MAIALSDVTVTVNNEPIAIVPNSFKFTEGFGEQTMRAASAGGGSVEPIYANNVEEAFSMCTFGLYNTIPDIEKARAWKANRDQNVVAMSGRTPDGLTINRTFSRAGLLSNYEVELGSDSTFELEFKSKPAV